jgi:uncharacterized membrane protein YhhN
LFNGWFFLAAGFALVDWVATGSGWKRMRYFTKGVTLAALLVWFSVVGGWRGALLWFGLGLVCGLAGDMLLQLPKRFFLAGLVAFLAGHICYIIGFLDTGLYLGETGLIFGTPFLGVSIWIFAQLLSGMRRRRENSAMIVPVIIYGAVISGMAVCAGLTLANPLWPLTSAFSCALGGIFFLVSDSILAFDQFVGRIQYSNLIVMVTYHLAQFLIAIGILLRLA